MSYIYFEPRTRPIGPGSITLPGCVLWFYVSGTSTLATIYGNSDLSATLPNPLAADATGFLPAIYLDPSVTYRRQLYDQYGTLLDDTDPAAIPPVAGPQILVKPADTSRNNDTTTTADPDLFSTALQNGYYTFDIALGIATTSTSNGGIYISVGHGTCTLANLYCAGFSLFNGTYTSISNRYITIANVNVGAPTIGPSGLNVDSFNIRGGVQITFPGTFGVNWAQYSSSNTPTILVAGSYLSISPIS
jgi:hypothetical protein